MVMLDKSNEEVCEKGDIKKGIEETKILNNDTDEIKNELDCFKCCTKRDFGKEDGTSIAEDLAKRLQSLKVDGTTDDLKLEESVICKKEDVCDSDDEGVIVRGDHKGEDGVLISRGPPGEAVPSEYYSQASRVAILANDIKLSQQQNRGAKRGHNQTADPLCKGIRTQDVREESSVAQIQFSRGPFKCAHGRPGKPTVRMLIEEKEQRNELIKQQNIQQQQQNLLPLWQTQQSQFTSAVQQSQESVVTNELNIPTDPISISDDDTERLPSYDIDTMLKILTDAEEMTQQAFKEQTVLPVNEIQKPTVNATQQRNHTNISTIQINPLSPESGYSTSSAPGSPKSISSRPSFSEEDQTPLPPDMEERLDIIDDWLQDEEVKSADVNAQCNLGESQLQHLQCQYVQNGPATNSAPPAAAQPCGTVAAPLPTPMQHPIKNNFPALQQNLPIVVNVVGVPNIIPQVCPQTNSTGKNLGRPPNSKGKQPIAARQRHILPKPTQQSVQIIPTAVTGSDTSVQGFIPNSVKSASTLATQSAPSQPAASSGSAETSSKPEPRTYTPIAPKDPQQRDQAIMEKFCEFLDKKKLNDILKRDPEGDQWLHSYIMHLNENPAVLYMINAIISRMKREHKEGNINIKQVINTQNNCYQTPVYLATVMNNQWVLDWLLKAGGDPNVVAISNTHSGPLRKGPLHYAASRGDECLDVLYVLLECRDTDLNLKNTEGLSPLHVAVQSHGKPIPKTSNVINSTRVIEALIQKGANLEEVDDKNGKTPIHYLVETQCYDLINAIFNVIPEADLKSYLKKQTFGNNTALHIAAQSVMSNIDEHKKIIKLLLEKGADPAIKNSENNTASQIAYKPHREELAPLLKPSHGKSIHNTVAPAAHTSWSPVCHPAPIKPAPKRPAAATAVNPNPAAVILVQTLPVTTTQMVQMQAISQPVQSQIMAPVVTLPQNTVLAKQPINCTIPGVNQPLTYAITQKGNQVPVMAQMPQVPQQIMSQSCYTSPLNSPQMLPMGSPRIAHSPPKVRSPEMAQANHDFTSTSQKPVANSPPSAATYVIQCEPNVPFK